MTGSFGPLNPVLILRTRILLYAHPGNFPIPSNLAKQLAVMPDLFWKDAGSGHGFGLALLSIQASTGLVWFVLVSSRFRGAREQASAPPSTSVPTQGSQLLGLSRFKNHNIGGENILLVQLPASDLLREPFNWPEPGSTSCCSVRGTEKATRPKLSPKKRVKAQLSHCHVTPTRTETFFLLKFSEGTILTLCFSLHLDLCLDSALCNCVLCESLTPHALPWHVLMFPHAGFPGLGLHCQVLVGCRTRR